MRGMCAATLAWVAPILFFLLGTSAHPRDLAVLATIVAPAYTAMNFAIVCARYDPVFLAETSGPHGTAIAYAQHIKDDAVSSLSYEEATIALKAAADAARDLSFGPFGPSTRKIPRSNEGASGNGARAWPSNISVKSSSITTTITKTSCPS